MTLEDLLQFNIEEADKLSAEERIAICKPYWPITRPDPNKYKAAPTSNVLSPKVISEKKKANNQLQMGMKLLEQYKHLLK